MVLVGFQVTVNRRVKSVQGQRTVVVPVLAKIMVEAEVDEDS